MSIKSLLVISPEPALAEALAHELPEFTIIAATIQEAEIRLREKNVDLLVIDNETGFTPEAGYDTIVLNRPVRLKDTIYLIHEKFKNRMLSLRQEISLATGYILSLSGRNIRSVNGSVSVLLTEKECDLLQAIVENSHPVLTRDILLQQIWGYNSREIDTHTLETHIYRLRAKLKQANESLDIVFSEEEGYKLG